jgi:outer membrane protein
MAEKAFDMRHFVRHIVCGALLTLPTVAGVARAQGVGPAQGRPSEQWSLGLVSVVRGGVYAGESFQTRLVPGVGFEGERFFLRGLTAGAYLIRDQTVELSAIGSWSFGADREDFDDAALRAQGLDPDRIQGRDGALEGGLAIRYRTPYGDLAAQALTTIVGSQEGGEIALAYGVPVRVNRFVVTPEIAVKWVSAGKADYLFGIRGSEVAPGQARYSPGSYAAPSVGVSYLAPLSASWTSFGTLRYERLPAEVRRSPLVRTDLSEGSVSGVFGLLRSF